MRTRHAVPLLATLFLAAGCARNLAHVEVAGRLGVAVTAPPWTSAMYVARTEAGVVVIDLGWYGAGRALRRELRQLDAAPEDVTDVFLTHSHRDHIAAWKLVHGARFHMAAAEVPFFLEQRRHADLPSRLGALVLGNPAPAPEPLRLEGFSRDTTFVLGADTLHAFTVPGHTAGSTAYLFRAILFTGDATVHVHGFGAGPSLRLFTADVRQSRESLATLRRKVEGRRVDWICTAHAKCARPSERYWRKVTRDARL
jgi:glyoxylase-like metal-dependent hydrolase (beta-lactamase superfamily II)